MKWTSILAIYFLFWVASAFVLLPFGIKTHEELGIDKTPGQADSAPANFRPGRVALRATALAAVLTGAYVVNYIYGWVTPRSLMIPS
jgi:predicted secreted protein